MPLIAAKCTQCGGAIQVDNTKEAGICPFCHMAYVTEKAINNYNSYITNNFDNATVNILTNDGKQLIENGKTFIKLNDFYKAERVLKEYIEKYPSNYEGWMYLSYVNFLKSDNDIFSNHHMLKTFCCCCGKDAECIEENGSILFHCPSCKRTLYLSDSESYINNHEFFYCDTNTYMDSYKTRCIDIALNSMEIQNAKQVSPNHSEEIDSFIREKISNYFIEKESTFTQESNERLDEYNNTISNYKAVYNIWSKKNAALANKMPLEKVLYLLDVPVEHEEHLKSGTTRFMNYEKYGEYGVGSYIFKYKGKYYIDYSQYSFNNPKNQIINIRDLFDQFIVFQTAGGTRIFYNNRKKVLGDFNNVVKQKKKGLLSIFK